MFEEEKSCSTRIGIMRRTRSCCGGQVQLRRGFAGCRSDVRDQLVRRTESSLIRELPLQIPYRDTNSFHDDVISHPLLSRISVFMQSIFFQVFLFITACGTVPSVQVGSSYGDF